MARRQAPDRQLSFEEVGVIGQDAVESPVASKAPVTEVQAAPADAANPNIAGAHGLFAADFKKVEEEEGPQEVVLPSDYREWEGYHAINSAARDNFYFTVTRPGHVFTATGRYADARDVDRIYDVEPGQVVPEGQYLVGVNYLLPERERFAVLDGRRQLRVSRFNEAGHPEDKDDFAPNEEQVSQPSQPEQAARAKKAKE